MPPFRPPKTGTLPARGRKIMRGVYVGCRTQHPENTPQAKAMCAGIGWTAVRNAGFTKKSYRKK